MPVDLGRPLFPLGHVADVGHDAFDGRVVEQVSRFHLQPPPVAVTVLGPDLRQRLRLGVGHDGLEALASEVAVLGMDTAEHVSAGERLWVEAEDALDRRRGVLDRPLGVEDVDVVGRVREQRLESFPRGHRLLLCAVAFGGVPDPVGEDGVGVRAGAFLEVVGDAGRHRLRRDLLAPLPGEEDERQVGVGLPDRLEELEAVHAGHLVVADDAVEPLDVEAIEGVASTRLRDHVEAVVLRHQEVSNEVTEPLLVVDVQHADRRHCRP